jgi:hypothetical protein
MKVLRKTAGWLLRGEMIRVAAACWLAIFATVLAAFFFAYFLGSTNKALRPLGGDFPEFFAIGSLLRDFGTNRLYDLDFQDRVLHEVVPFLRSDELLPFAYPPFVAVPFVPLSLLPYPASLAMWLLISGAAYAGAIAITLRAVPALSCIEQLTVWLVALSFEPFAFECLVGGQLSTVGCLGMAAAVVLQRSERHFAAGLALSTLFYKPTLLVLALPMLVIVKEWRMLAGVFGGFACIAATSVATLGLKTNLDFLGVLTTYARAGGSAAGSFSTMKYVDLAAFLKLLGLPPGLVRPLTLTLILPAVAALAVAWRRAYRSTSQVARDLALAALLCLTSLCNVYGPIYDVLLCVPGLILAGTVLHRAKPSGLPSSCRAILLFLYLACLLSLPIAAVTRFQPVTPALACAGIYLIRASLAASHTADLIEGIERSDAGMPHA